MTGLPWTGDEAFRRELAGLSKSRLKLQISGGALLAIVSAGHVLDALMNGTLASKELWLFGMMLGLYVAAHYSMLLFAKRSLQNEACTAAIPPLAGEG